MALVKPIRAVDGKLKEMSSTDDLPNQVDIYELQQVLIKLIDKLLEIGLPIQDEQILNFYSKNK